MGFSFHGRKRKQMALPSPLSDFWVALARRIDQSKTIQRNGIQFKTSGAKICLRNRPTQLPPAQLWPRLQPHLILQTWLSNFFLLALRSEILPQKTIGCDPKKYILGIPNGTRVWGNLHPHENEASERNMKHSETPTLGKMKMKTPPMETWDAQKLTLRKRKCNIIYGWRHKTFHLNLTSRKMKLTRYQVEKWNTQKLPPSGKWKWHIIRWKNETLRNSHPQENEKRQHILREKHETLRNSHPQKTEKRKFSVGNMKQSEKISLSEKENINSIDSSILQKRYRSEKICSSELTHVCWACGRAHHPYLRVILMVNP